MTFVECILTVVWVVVVLAIALAWAMAGIMAIGRATNAKTGLGCFARVFSGGMVLLLWFAAFVYFCSKPEGSVWNRKDVLRWIQPEK